MKKITKICILAVTLNLTINSNSYSNTKEDSKIKSNHLLYKIKFDVEGHRGARGLLPENTLIAFKKALDLGVTTLEMDTIISKDKKVVISHDPFFSSEICSFPNGKPITDKDKINLYKMNYSDIAKYDCGMRGHPRFKKQESFKTNKPLLNETIKEIEKYIKSNNLKNVLYNIETKSEQKEDNISNPLPKEFANLLYQELKSLNILDRVLIQSFDPRTLKEFKKLNKNITVALLVENTLTLSKNLESLGFNPEVYSPDYHLIDEKLIKDLKKLNIKLIPWTVNTKEEMIKLKKMGVDGIITDYPNIGVELLK